MEKCRRIVYAFMDVVEVYVPCLAFMVVFVSYVIMIAYRYIFHAQLNWIYELSMIAFIWAVIFPASYGGRNDGHIVFSILYDLLSERAQRWFRIFGNAIIIITFLILLPHAYDAIAFLARKKSSLMKIPFNLIYFPFISFVILTIVHFSVRLLRDVLPQSKTAKREQV